MEYVEFERILDAKINPLVDAISRLERSNERLSAALIELAKIQTVQTHLSETLDRHLSDTEHIKSEVFNRIRTLEEHKACDEVRNTLTEHIQESHDRGNAKLWDVIKIVIAGVFGGFTGWIAGSR